jgi:hypothetical protein
MSPVKPSKAPAAVGFRSGRPHHRATAPTRDPLRPQDPAHRREAQRARRDHRPTTPPDADAAHRSPAEDDSGHGMVLLTLTVGGSLAVVPAVWFIALVPALWAAALTLLILVALTGAIVFTVMHATSS